MWCVDQDFPAGTQLTPLEREREAHMAFADARRRVYIGREEYFTQIDAYMNEDQAQPFVLLGESGQWLLSMSTVPPVHCTAYWQCDLFLVVCQIIFYRK